MNEWPEEGWVLSPRFTHEKTGTVFSIPQEVYADSLAEAKHVSLILAAHYLRARGFTINGVKAEAED